MEERLKQRLVGAIVLVSLAVVFVPILFDSSHEPDGELSAPPVAEIPERPRDRSASPASDAIEAPETPRLDAEVERERSRPAPVPDAAGRDAPSGALAPGSPSTSSEAPASTGASGSPASAPRSDSPPARPEPAAGEPDDASGKTPAARAPAAASDGWAVQLGSFREPKNALALRERLQAGGYSAFVEPGSSARDKLSRVFVGPMPSREQARASAARLRREMELEGIVVRYSGG